MKGMIGEQQRMHIAYTTRRGLVGKAKRGGAADGKTLGYVREQSGQDGSTDHLVVDKNEAALVRLIFELYADGASLKQICNLLNVEGVPSPRARERGKYNAGIWNPSTLPGSVELGEGVLNNELYIGKRIFNRRTWEEVPDDKRGFCRVPRLNPEADWVVSEELDLRVIDQDLWQRVKRHQVEARSAHDDRFKLTGNPLSGAKRLARLPSGLVECGCCSGPFCQHGWQMAMQGRHEASLWKCIDPDRPAREPCSRWLAGPTADARDHR